MLQKAIEKLRSEMDRNKNNSYIQVVGQYLIKRVESNPSSAEKILASDKSIEKSLDAIRKVAEKRKVGNCAVIAPDEGFAIIMDYFGISGASTAQLPSAGNTVPVEPPQSTSGEEFDLRLEDLL